MAAAAEPAGRPRARWRLLRATPFMLGVKMDIEMTTCYDEASIEKGRGLGTLTTLRPTSNRPTFLGQPFFPSS